MKTTNLMKTILLIVVLGLAISCSKDKKSPTPADSRNVKYEITGNATGTFDATYITGSGSGSNVRPTSLPWSKEIVVQAGVGGVSISSAVTGATPGKTITAKIYVGGVVKKEQTETVQANGVAIIGSLNYILK